MTTIPVAVKRSRSDPKSNGGFAWLMIAYDLPLKSREIPRTAGDKKAMDGNAVTKEELLT